MLYRLLRRYAAYLLRLAYQSIACNALHSAEERMCRWLLMTQDRAGGAELPLTHEFLAEMLGVRRPTVTLIAGTLQRAGLIDARRGMIRVADRQELESASCECYRLVRNLYGRVMQ
jgi:CRP-like cAMP-binding protein